MKAEGFEEIIKIMQQGEIKKAALELIEFAKDEDEIKALNTLITRLENNKREFNGGLRSTDDYNVERNKITSALFGLLPTRVNKNKYVGKSITERAIQKKNKIDQKKDLDKFRGSHGSFKLFEEEIDYVFTGIEDEIRRLKEDARWNIGVLTGDRSIERNMRCVNWETGSFQVFISRDFYYSIENLKVNIGLCDGPVSYARNPYSPGPKKVMHEEFEVIFDNRTELTYQSSELKMKKDDLLGYCLEIILENYSERQ
jgi:hypothetical protein